MTGMMAPVLLIALLAGSPAGASTDPDAKRSVAEGQQAALVHIASDDDDDLATSTQDKDLEGLFH